MKKQNIGIKKCIIPRQNISKLPKDEFNDIELVIVDPPRAGLDNKTIDNIKRIGVDAFSDCSLLKNTYVQSDY